MTRIPKHRCGNCAWYDQKEPLMADELPWGYCFIAPPAAGTAVRPIVRSQDRCARWEVRTDEPWEPTA